MRRTKFTLAQMRTALEACSGFVAVAAQRLGCSRSTLYRHIEKSPTLQTVIADQREVMLDRAELFLQRAIMDGQAWAICFYLKTQGKSRGYVERAELTGKNGGAIAVTDPFTKVLVGLWEEHAEHRNGSTHAS